MLKQAGVSAADWTVVSVPHAEVQNYLLAGDVGLLLRRPSPINSVASPMKFAEYLACGAPVLASAGIGDVNGMISTYGVGRVLAAPEEAGRALGNLIKFSYDGARRLLREALLVGESGEEVAMAVRARSGAVCSHGLVTAVLTGGTAVLDGSSEKATMARNTQRWPAESNEVGS